MICRVYVEKKPGIHPEAAALKNDIRSLLRLPAVTDVRILNRYDVENIDKALFDYCKTAVFSEVQVDNTYDELPLEGAAAVFAVEYLPGQFDQRADSAAQCIQIISQQERPLVRTARVFLLYGEVSDAALAAIKKYVINPVECREASLEAYDTLRLAYEKPAAVEVLQGFTKLDEAGLNALLRGKGLAMDLDDLRFCQRYFHEEGRDPTLTEIRVIDTYWSDHCRHTTFLTTLDRVRFEDPLLEGAYRSYLTAREALGVTKPVCLMDIATLAAKHLQAAGGLEKLDVSEEINACTVKIDVEVDGKREPWLLLFKNETHNHPTEIEPFGGAATCIGGAIRDPLSGRAYVYAAMRLTGAADPLADIGDTLPGKLPQRKLTAAAAAGYSSYGNQIGLATGLVDELYHPGFVAKRLEIGAVVGAVPAAHVRREKPAPGDLVIALGGRTGRDGCGGATGSSKAHDLRSLESCGAEVQKGNAPEERKLQRLFRNPEAARLIKRCNDFGAGGVSVAIGELADGLEIFLDNMPKKYEGLDGTELAISESQERMAVVIEQAQAENFLRLADEENLEATVVARVTALPRLTMRWDGAVIADISRELLDSNGAEKHADAAPAAPESFSRPIEAGGFAAAYRALCADLNVCSRRGLSERFDSTIGAGTLLMPFGGKYQLTPIQAMAHKVSDETRDTGTCSLMTWGCNPYIAEKSPYHGAYLAVVESVSKLAAAGAGLEDVYLSFQEFFGKPHRDPRRWGIPLAALLGAFRAQMDLGIAAIGGKDSMSGSFEALDVPPTLVSFAVTTEKREHVISPEFKAAGHAVSLLLPEVGTDGLPTPASLRRNWEAVRAEVRTGRALAVYTPGYGGVADCVFKMCLGNGLGFAFDDRRSTEELFGYTYGAFVIELTDEGVWPGVPLGRTTQDAVLRRREETVPLSDLLLISEAKLEPVFPCKLRSPEQSVPPFTYSAKERVPPVVKAAKPRVLIPVFPGTNCEYDSAKAFAAAGAEPEIFVVRNLTTDAIARSVERFALSLRQAQLVFLPGGFSAGDEPDGSGKFITAFFRSAAVQEETMALLDKRGGLMAGICNGFQALIKLGLVPYGRITDPGADDPTLTFNTIGRHQSRIVRVRVASNLSPWLSGTQPGEVYSVPVSHGEGRFLLGEAAVRRLAEAGQIATQYVDQDGKPTNDILFNPNGSVCAVEGITSPDGRVLGRMGHTERTGCSLYVNVPGRYDMKLFESAVAYFR